MFRDAFAKIDEQETADLLRDINPVLQGGGFDPASATVLGQDLAFYPGWRFLDVADYSSIPALRRFVVHRAGQAVVLDSTNGPIYELNRIAPIALDEDNVADYVRFFFTYVRGRHGRFIITENPDDVAWREEPPPAARKAISQMLTPARVTGADSEGRFMLSVCMMFRDSLFRTEVRVRPDGAVSLENEELLIEDMPVLDDTFGQ